MTNICQMLTFQIGSYVDLNIWENVRDLQTTLSIIISPT